MQEKNIYDAENPEYVNWVNVKTVWTKLEKDFNLFLEVNSKGTMCFYTVDPKSFKEQHKDRWTYHIKPLYVITKAGRIEKFNKIIKRCRIIKECGKLESSIDYINAINVLYRYCFNLEIRRWRDKLKINPNLFNQIPNVFLERINPKLITVKGLGVFED